MGVNRGISELPRRERQSVPLTQEACARSLALNGMTLPQTMKSDRDQLNLPYPQLFD